MVCVMGMMMLVSMDKDLFKCWGTLKIHGVERLWGSFFFPGRGVWSLGELVGRQRSGVGGISLR